jgi:hypothetical protein
MAALFDVSLEYIADRFSITSRTCYYSSQQPRIQPLKKHVRAQMRPQAGTLRLLIRVVRLYAARIMQYAETWQGGNYKGLAWFICQQSSNKLSPPFSTLIAQTLYHDGFRTERNNLDFEDDRIPTLQNQSDLTADRIRVVYLRGLLTPECILDIGSRLSINPEYFRRHLNFLQLSKRNHFDLPTSQSSARHFPCFKIITICIRQQPIRLSELRDARKQEREAVKRYQRDLAINITPGEPIIRRYSVLNANLIAVEQNVSVAFTRGKEGECYST